MGGCLAVPENPRKAPPTQLELQLVQAVKAYATKRKLAVKTLNGAAMKFPLVAKG